MLDNEGNAMITWPALECSDVIKLLAFPRKGCHFLPSSTPPNALMVAIFYRKSKKLFMHLSSLSGHERTIIESQCEIPLSNTEDIIDVACDESGHASVLGMLLSYFGPKRPQSNSLQDRVEPGYHSDSNTEMVSFLSHHRRTLYGSTNLRSLASRLLMPGAKSPS